MGVGLSLVQTLVQAVEKAGGSDKDIHFLVRSEAEDVLKKIAILVIKEAKKFRRSSNLVVDYRRPFKKSVAAGCYDNIDSNITENHFPTKAYEREKKEVSFRLFHFYRNIQTDDAIQKMKEEGYRPATMRELLAFGEANPELQMKFIIIALNANFEDCLGDECFVCLNCLDSGERVLESTIFDSGWCIDCRFLGVAK